MKIILIAAILMFCIASVASPSKGAPQLGEEVVLMESVKLLPGDGRSGDDFGIDVDIDGDLIIVGGWESDDIAQGDGGQNAGSAYLFSRSGQQLHKLTASDGQGGNNFGLSVAIHGSYALVGSPRNTAMGVEAGAAYVYDVNTGQELRKLVHDELSPDDEFGFSVALDETLALIGAWSENIDGNQSGAAYLFDVVTGSPLHRLLPSNLENSFLFGNAVALSGSRALVGAYGSGPGTRTGAAYVFDTDTGEQSLELVAADGRELDEFGYSVALDGSIAVIGAPRHAPGGAAYVFNLDSGEQIAKFVAPVPQDNFGSSVAISESIIAIGASDDDLVYLFNLLTGELIASLNALDLTGSAGFAWSLAISDQKNIVVGAPFAGDSRDRSDIGAAYLFVIPEPTSALLLFIVIAVGFPYRTVQRTRRFHFSDPLSHARG